MNITSSFCSVVFSARASVFKSTEDLDPHYSGKFGLVYTLFVFSLLAVSHERPSLPLLVFVCHIDYLLFDLIVQLWKGTT